MNPGLLDRIRAWLDTRSSSAELVEVGELLVECCAALELAIEVRADLAAALTELVEFVEATDPASRTWPAIERARAVLAASEKPHE